DDDPLLRQKAITALQEAGGSGAIRALIDRIRGGGFDGPNEAADALVNIGEQAVRPMVAALPEMDHNAHWTTLLALARMGKPATTALCAALPGTATDLKKI